MVNRMSSFILLMAMVLASMELHGSMAKEYTVGDSYGWAVPTNDDFYGTWSSRQAFKTNDVLVFNFINIGIHTVAEVTKEAYDNCDNRQPISIQTTSPARFTIKNASDHYYICTGGEGGRHCMLSQKLAIRVSASTKNSYAMLTP